MNKLERLQKILVGLRSVVVAYSGGLDSAFLLKVAIETLGKRNVLAVTARSEMYPLSEYREAIKIARKLGAWHVTLRTSELNMPNFRDNPVDRCYYCKIELFRKLDTIRREHGLRNLLDGTNYDDLKDVRYGRRAARELRVKSPLLEAKLTKADIRKLSRRFGLPTWNKPSFACLASRIPVNVPITEAALRRIGQAEEFVRGLGFRQARVRLYGKLARIEVDRRDLCKMVRLRDSIVKKLKRLGFVYVTIDLEGYRTGSMHEGNK